MRGFFLLVVVFKLPLKDNVTTVIREMRSLVVYKPPTDL